LNTFSCYIDSLKKTKPFLDAIDTNEAPDFASSDKINKKPNTFFLELPNEQKWQLGTCKPCQAIHKMLQRSDGSFDHMKSNEIKEDNGCLYNSSFQRTIVERRATKDWCGNISGYKDQETIQPISQDELIPMDVHNKALLLEKCLLALEAQELLEKSAQFVETYFLEDVKNTTNK
jgi:hypothetical protein